MKKTVTNSVIFIMAKALLDDNCFRKNTDIKTRMAVRQALKFNSVEVENKYKILVEMTNEIINECQMEFIDCGKAEMDGAEFKLNDGLNNEFLDFVNRKLYEMESQMIDIEIKTIPEKELELYLKKNDGEFTDLELDVLEMFVENNDSEDGI